MSSVLHVEGRACTLLCGSSRADVIRRAGATLFIYFATTGSWEAKPSVGAVGASSAAVMNSPVLLASALKSLGLCVSISHPCQMRSLWVLSRRVLVFSKWVACKKGLDGAGSVRDEKSGAGGGERKKKRTQLGMYQTKNKQKGRSYKKSFFFSFGLCVCVCLFFKNKRERWREIVLPLC